ncbi:AraC family transcriptional regulator [Saccharomonospora sp. NPDC006951]
MPQRCESGTEYVVEGSSTGDVAPRERAEYWTDLVTGYQCVLRMEYPHRGDFRGRTLLQRTPAYQLVRWISDEDVASRTRRIIRRDPDDDYRMIFPVTGRMALRMPGREVTMLPGQAGLTPMGEPFQLWQSTGTEAIVLTFPRREADLRLGCDEPCVTGLDLTSGLGRIVRDLITGLIEERHALDRCRFDAVSDRLVELICLLILGDDVAGSSTLAALDAAARRYVREHASDPALGPHSLAAGLGWSLRQVQLALKASGTTPRRLIKEERLRVAKDLLTNNGRSVAIADLAHRLGFSSAAAFSNAFRERYGVRPRDIR